MSGPDLLLTLLALPVLAAAAYLAGLALLARHRPPPPAGSGPRFDVIVPAHDEERGVGATVRSLLAVDYPGDLFRVVVVADNCGDRTAEAAAAAGARVLVRQNPGRRGKGYALAFAFDELGREAFADAFVVVDADSLVSANLLGAFAARLQAGALALQADYGVRNREASWRTRLLHVAFTLFHGVRSRGREALSLSCGLRGNGMAFARDLLRRVPYDAFSVVEDLEYGLRLGLAGVAVRYVGEASVVGEMAAAERASRPQRSRWESGRRALARQHGMPLLVRAIRERSALLLDLALDLLVPPFAPLVLVTLLGLIVSASGVAYGLGTTTAVVAWTASALALSLYLARGWRDAGAGWRGLRDLVYVPGFILWKLRLARLEAGTSKRWVRTPRETPAGGRAPD